jgi:hypothetical protein
MRRTRTQSGGLGVCCAQRFIVRIIFMVPLYSLLSFLSLLMEQNSVYFATFRDWCARARLGSCCCEGVRRLFELAAAALLLLTCARTAPQCSSVFCSAFQHSTAQRTALKVQRPLAARAALQRGSAKRRPRNKDHALHDRRRLSSVRGPRARSYEAFVVYTFLALCLAYVGGPGSVEVKMNGYQLYPSVLYCTCCLPALPVNGAFVRTCKRGALQFVWLKPVLAGLTVVLYTQRMYTEGYWGPDNGCARRARAPARTAPPARTAAPLRSPLLHYR